MNFVPIHTDWKSMIGNMRSQYCSKGDSMISRDMSDGSKASMCKKGWSVFFATLRKKGWKETKPRGKVTAETFAIAVEETAHEIDAVSWFENRYAVGGVVGSKKNEMEKRSGLPSATGRQFALTDDSKESETKKKIIQWFETKYKKKEDPNKDKNCGCDE